MLKNVEEAVRRERRTPINAPEEDTMTNAKDADSKDTGFGRRTFLEMATAAGAAPLAPALIGAASVQTASAQTAPAHHEETNHETERLAAYAAKLRYEELPAAVVQRAKDCICDTVGAIVYGAELPWSKMIIAHARRTSAAGRSSILGSEGSPVQAGAAALANGAMTHAFELDSLTKPDSGSHPGATVFTAALAVTPERGLSGRRPLPPFLARPRAIFRAGHPPQ